MKINMNHEVTANPEMSLVFHHITFSPQPVDIMDRRRAIMMAETYLRQWAKDRHGILSLRLESEKIFVDEKMVTSKTPGLERVSGQWISSLKTRELEFIRENSAKHQKNG